MDEADREELIGRLKKDKTNKELRSELIDPLDESPAEYLAEAEKEKLADQIILKAPEAKKRNHFTKDDRNTLIATASCDILAVIPVILTFILLGFGAFPGWHPGPYPLSPSVRSPTFTPSTPAGGRI